MQLSLRDEMRALRKEFSQFPKELDEVLDSLVSIDEKASHHLLNQEG